MAKTITVEVEAVSVKNASVKTNDQNAKGGWYNYAGKDREGAAKQLMGVKKGDVLEILLDETGQDYVAIIDHKEGVPAPVHHAPERKSMKDFLDDYITFPELLEKLKNETDGKYSIETKILFMDWEKHPGVCVVQSHIKGEFGVVTREKIVEGKLLKVEEPNPRWATAHGDCTPQNGGMVKEHFIRMAETRATARALRMILGIGKTAEEEVTL